MSSNWLRFLAGVSVLTGAILGVSGGAAANGRPAAQEGWSITLGAGGLYSPDYEGSDDYEGRALPYLQVRYEDWLSLSVPEGLKISLIRDDTWRAGVLAGYRFDRDAGDNIALAGWGDVDGAIELGGFVEWRARPIKIALDVRADVSGAHEGAVAKLSAAYETQIAMARLSIGPSVTWVSDNYNQTYFGITAPQAALAVLPYVPYRAEGGIKDWGFGANVFVPISDRWSAFAFANVSQLLGDAADSPIVAREGSETQFSAGLFLGYKLN